MNKKERRKKRKGKWYECIGSRVEGVGVELRLVDQWREEMREGKVGWVH
jgi:hypothetical protein